MSRSTQRFIIALGTLTLGAVFAGALIFFKIPSENESVLNFALGLVLGWGGAVIGFYFGTSESSVHKNDMIEGAMNKGTHVYSSLDMPEPAFGKDNS